MKIFSRALAVTAATAISAAWAVHASAAPGAAHVTARAMLKGPAQPYDFNGDGRPDLALGSPYGTVSGHKSAGFVTIVYGSSSGVNTSKKQVFSQNTAGVPGVAEAGDHFGFALASLDYDGDGYADLLVGSPDEDTSKGKDAGSETILWGSASGLTGSGSDVIGEPGGAGPSHRFGYSLAAADLDGDGYWDWVDTAPGSGYFYPFRNPGPAMAAPTSGRVFAPKAQRMSVRHGKLAAAADAAVSGFIPATGDVNGDGKPDLVMGWQDTDSPSGFEVLYGWNDQGPAGVADVATRVDSLAVGDFDGDGHGDIAVGDAGESAGTGGHVTVYQGDADVTLGTTSTIDQDTPSVPGTGVPGDRFGWAVSAGDVNKDGKADLAVGVPYRAISSRSHAGEAIMLYGSASGLTGAGSQAVSQNTSGVPGASEANDAFGWAVSLLNVNGDGYADLIAGAPKENGTDGAVSVLKGSASGVSGTGSVTFGAGTLGITGKDAQVGVRIGRSA